MGSVKYSIEVYKDFSCACVELGLHGYTDGNNLLRDMKSIDNRKIIENLDPSSKKIIINLQKTNIRFYKSNRKYMARFAGVALVGGVLHWLMFWAFMASSQKYVLLFSAIIFIGVGCFALYRADRYEAQEKRAREILRELRRAVNRDGNKDRT